MKPELLYLDSSAIVKLIAQEVETSALLAFLPRYPERVSSALARVEVLRALRRSRAGTHERHRANEVLARIGLIRIDDEILDAAAELEPAELRSLDAIHLATALSIREDLAAVIAYDQRFRLAARQLKLEVLAPE